MLNGILICKPNDTLETAVEKMYFRELLPCIMLVTAGCVGHHSEGPVISAEKPKVHRPGLATFELCVSGMPTDGMWKCDPVFADLSGDGFLDLVALPRLGRGPRIWLGDGQGGWSEWSSQIEWEGGSCGGGLDVGDVNNDGILDLVVADHCQGVFVYVHDASGRWEPKAGPLYPEGVAGGELTDIYTGAEDVALGDVNGDGFLDILAGSSDKGGVNVYLGDGTGRDWIRTSDDALPDSGWATRVMLFDVNRDDKLDVVASYHEGPRVWLNDGQGLWVSASVGLPRPVISGLYTGLAIGDLDEDGLVDLAVANWVDGPEVYFQKKDGSWLKAGEVFPEMNGGAVGLALGDLDGDQHLDMVVSGRLTTEGGFVRGVYLLRGDGTGRWEYVPSTGIPATGLAATTGVALADVNEDGRLDVAAASGLIVETVPGPTEPAIPARLLAWCSTADCASSQEPPPPP